MRELTVEFFLHPSAQFQVLDSFFQANGMTEEKNGKFPTSFVVL
jgi:hypothetical protein